MENFLTTIQSLLNESGDTIEIVDAGKPYKIQIINKGKIYDGLADPQLPLQISSNIHQVIVDDDFLHKVFGKLVKEYGAQEAEERICWCMFGGFDNQPDIVQKDNADDDTCNIEIRPACAMCPYGKPFCKRFVIPLTDREQQCFLLMREGMTDKEIGTKLGISYNTVTTHFENALVKMRATTGKAVTRAYIIQLLNLAGV